MSEKTREAIQSLKPVVDQLNAATDDASATLDEADAEFRSLGLGIEASVLLAEGDPFENGDLGCVERERVLLEYRNGENGWGLYVCRYTVRGPDDAPDQVRLLESESPASRVARELKLRAVNELDALVSALRRKATSYLGPGFLAEYEAEYECGSPTCYGGAVRWAESADSDGYEAPSPDLGGECGDCGGFSVRCGRCEEIIIAVAGDVECVCGRKWEIHYDRGDGSPVGFSRIEDGNQEGDGDD